jgi:NAD(P)H dehydrogenase (quinone)
MQRLSDSVQVTIVYYSRFGVVRDLAQCIAEGVRRVEGATPQLLEVEDQPIEELRAGEDEAAMERRRAVAVNRLISADALIVGAPGYFGTMASPLKRFFEDTATASAPPGTDRSRPWRHSRFHNKVGAAFTSTATPHGGNEQTLFSILTMLMHLGLIIVTPGQQAPILENETPTYGATAISGPRGDRPLNDAEREYARQLGTQVAEVTLWLRLGWSEWSRQREVQGRIDAARMPTSEH